MKISRGTPNVTINGSRHVDVELDRFNQLSFGPTTCSYLVRTRLTRIFGPQYTVNNFSSSALLCSIDQGIQRSTIISESCYHRSPAASRSSRPRSFSHQSKTSRLWSFSPVLSRKYFRQRVVISARLEKSFDFLMEAVRKADHQPKKIKQSKNCHSLDRDESCTRHFDGWPARFEKQGRESIFPSPQQHTAAKCNLPSDRPTSNLGRPVDSILARTATF
jgi:hypothetical protein